MNNKSDIQTEEIRRVIESALMREYGFLIGPECLWRIMGMKSPQALRQAEWRGVVPVRLISIPNRRGRFALASDIADWVISLIVEQSKVEVEEKKVA